MITVFFYMTAKPGREQAFHETLVRMTRATREKDEGCINYVFHQQLDQPREYLLHEQWRDRTALDAHIAHMKRLLGEPPAGAKLPAELHAICEQSQGVLYRVVA